MANADSDAAEPSVGAGAGAGTCTACQATKTAAWRSDKVTKDRVCNRCYYQKYPLVRGTATSDDAAKAKEEVKPVLKPEPDGETGVKRKKEEKDKKSKKDKKDKNGKDDTKGELGDEDKDKKSKGDTEKNDDDGDDAADDADAESDKKGDVECPPTNVEDHPKSLQVESTGSAKVDGRYERLSKLSEGRPCYEKPGAGEVKSQYLYWHQNMWLVCQKLGKGKKFASAYVKAAGPLQVPTEPYPHAWTFVKKDKLTGEKAVDKILACRVRDVVVVELAGETPTALQGLMAATADAGRRKARVPKEVKEADQAEPDMEVAEKPKKTKATGAGEAADIVPKPKVENGKAKGAAAPEVAAEVKCPHCKIVQPMPGKFCCDCGKPMEVPAAEVAKDEESESESATEAKASSSASESSVKSSASSDSSEEENDSKKAKTEPAAGGGSMPAAPRAAPPKPAGPTPEEKRVKFEERCRMELKKEQIKGVPAMSKKMDFIKKTLIAKSPDELLKQMGLTPITMQKLIEELEGIYQKLVYGEVSEPLHKTEKPVKKLLRGSSGMRPTPTGVKLQWTDLRKDAAKLRQEKPVISHRFLSDLWYQNPGSVVSCETCQKMVPQTSGCLSGALDRSQFAQREFHCIECHNRKFGNATSMWQQWSDA